MLIAHLNARTFFIEKAQAYVVHSSIFKRREDLTTPLTADNQMQGGNCSIIPAHYQSPYTQQSSIMQVLSFSPREKPGVELTLIDFDSIANRVNDP